MRITGSRAARLFGLALSVVASAAFAAPAGAVGECADTMPVSDLHRGMSGTGWTVAQGTQPEPFDVEVLGVLPDAIGPGRDMIIVDTSSPRYARTRGIWYGMSGSPVYDDASGKLIGVLAFGLSFGPSPIAGLTPAEDVVSVLDYRSATSAMRAGASLDLPATVKLPSAMVRTIARSTGREVAEVGNSLARLKVPLSASGLGERGMKRLNRFIAKKNLPFLPFAGSSAGAGETAAPGDLDPGDNFASVISYGDLTWAGIGTTSYVCDGKALAFGHPFFFNGRTLMGANTADAITVVDDPVFGPYKLANVTGGVGRVDQDRLAAIRALLGAGPPTIGIRSSVKALDSGRARDGATDLVFPEWVDFVSFIHFFTNIDTTFDQIGPGSSKVGFRITGTREDGRTWRFARGNYHFDEWDISIRSAFEMYRMLSTLAFNPLEKVRITGVEMSADVEETVKQYTISSVLVSKNGGPYVATRAIRARPGSLLRVRVVLMGASADEIQNVDMTLRLPRGRTQRGWIEIAGAPRPKQICFPKEPCEGGVLVKTFDQLVRVLSRQRQNNLLISQLRLGRADVVYDREIVSFDRYIRGLKVVSINGGGGGGGGKCCPDEGGDGGEGEEAAVE